MYAFLNSTNTKCLRFITGTVISLAVMVNPLAPSADAARFEFSPSFSVAETYDSMDPRSGGSLDEFITSLRPGFKIKVPTKYFDFDTEFLAAIIYHAKQEDENARFYDWDIKFTTKEYRGFTLNIRDSFSIIPVSRGDSKSSESNLAQRNIVAINPVLQRKLPFRFDIKLGGIYSATTHFNDDDLGADHKGHEHYAELTYTVSPKMKIFGRCEIEYRSYKGADQRLAITPVMGGSIEPIRRLKIAGYWGRQLINYDAGGNVEGTLVDVLIRYELGRKHAIEGTYSKKISAGLDGFPLRSNTFTVDFLSQLSSKAEFNFYTFYDTFSSGGGINSDATVWGLGTRLTYKIRKYIVLLLQYDYFRNMGEDDPQSGFRRNRVTIGLGGQI